MLDRRQLLFALASLVSPSAGASTIEFESRYGLNHLEDQGLVKGCVFACEATSNHKPSNAASIDFWAARVSDIQSSHLPTFCRRVVVWDDVFSLRRASLTVGEVFDAISRFYEFDARQHPHQAGVHLDQVSNLDEVLSSLLSARSNARPRNHIAFVDLDSSGVTSLDWPRLLPHLRAHYDLLVGTASEIDDFELSQLSEQRLSASSCYCDTVVMIPDPSSHHQDELSYDDIMTLRTEYVRNLMMSAHERI